MKKTLLLALAAIATIFTSCSSDIINDNDDSNNGQGKGMTLIANVEQDDTRASLTTSDDISGKWSFKYTNSDKVKVGNNTIDNYYTFTKSGETFSSTDAKVTSSAADWYAYYPGTNIDLTNQQGTSDSAAKLYALAGKTAEATTGSTPLQISMDAKAAVLRIVNVDNYGPCDIYLKTKDGKYVSGLKANNNAGYDVVESDNKVPVFHKDKNGNAGIYYVIVPAGVYLEVWNDNIKFKTTSNGLSAGRYYTLTSGPTSGTATAKLAKGKTKPVKWVQLWIGGPRIALENVAENIAFKDDFKKGENYVWGSFWCTPSVSDVSSLYYYDENIGSIINDKLLECTYEFQDKHGFTLTGTQPGYTKNSLFLSGSDGDNEDHITSKFLLSDGNKEGYGTTINFTVMGKLYYFASVHNEDPNYTKYPVRPVLSQETVLWGEENIR